MGFFTFLTGQQEEQQQQPNPEGWKVRRKGKDYWEVNPDTPAGPEDEITREDQTPIATADEMKTYSQRRGETSSKVFQTADKIIDKYSAIAPAEMGPLAEKAKRDIRANPDDAARILEKYFEKANKITPPDRFNDPKYDAMTGGPTFRRMPSLYDQDFSALESYVRGLRTMKRGAQEKALSEGLAETDLKKNLSQLESLKGQLEMLTKEIATAKDSMPEAVSKRGEAEQNKIIGDKQQKAAAIAEHVKQLEAMTAGQQPTIVNAPPAVPDSSTMPQFKDPVSHFMDGLGIHREQVPYKVHDALNAVGIPPDQWGATDIEPTAGLMRVMGEMDKTGDFARLIVQQISLARQQDMADQQNGAGSQTQPQPQQQQGATGQQENSAISRTEARIQSREQEIRQLYAQLRESPFMRTWPGIILYVLVGMLTQNPAFAARLIGGVGNRDAVDKEIRGIQFELRRLDAQLARQEREEAVTKREAARRLQHKDDVADQRKWEMSKMMIQHNLIIERNAKRGNPETFIMKKLASDFQRSLGMASKFQSEMDQYARTMNNELAEQNARADAKRKWGEAKRNYDYYMQKAAMVDGDIRQMGGAVMEQGEDTEE